MKEAEANYKKAADDVARYKLLVEKEEISQQKYDQAAQTAAAAKAIVAILPSRQASTIATHRYRGSRNPAWWCPARSVCAGPCEGRSLASRLRAPETFLTTLAALQTIAETAPSAVAWSILLRAEQ